MTPKLSKVRLLATDMDHTLLSGHPAAINTRTRAALQDAARAGLRVMAVSGRQTYSQAELVTGTPLLDLAIGSNGAVVADLATREIIREDVLTPEAQAELTYGLKALFPDLKVMSVRNGGDDYVVERGYLESSGGAHNVWPPEHVDASLADVLAVGGVKLVARTSLVSTEELYQAAIELAIPGCEPSISGAAFLEVAAAGVNKGTALAWTCERLGIDASEVVAIGDNVNDVEMIRWAGLGVAVANSTPEALEAADTVTVSNNEDAVALLIEEILG